MSPRSPTLINIKDTYVRKANKKQSTIISILSMNEVGTDNDLIKLSNQLEHVEEVDSPKHQDYDLDGKDGFYGQIGSNNSIHSVQYIQEIKQEEQNINERIVKILQKTQNLRKQDDIEFLKLQFGELQFFKKIQENLPLKKYNQLFLCIKHQKLKRFETLFNIDDIGRCFYIIISGSVYIMNEKVKQKQAIVKQETLQNNDIPEDDQGFQINLKELDKVDQMQFLEMKQKTNNLKVVLKLYPGQSFGEVALQQKAYRTATVICSEDTEFAVLTRDDYNTIVQSYHAKMFDENIKFLKSISFLKCWNDAYLNNLLILSNIIEFQKGNTVYKYGDVADSLYLIIEGEFEIKERISDDVKQQQQSNFQEQMEQTLQDQYSDMLHLNRNWKKQHSKNQGKEVSICIVGKSQSLGMKEISEKISKRVNSAYCKSISGKVYKIGRKHYLNTLQNQQHLEEFLKENEMKKKWRENQKKTIVNVLKKENLEKIVNIQEENEKLLENQLKVQNINQNQTQNNLNTISIQGNESVCKTDNNVTSNKFLSNTNINNNSIMKKENQQKSKKNNCIQNQNQQQIYVTEESYDLGYYIHSIQGEKELEQYKDHKHILQIQKQNEQKAKLKKIQELKQQKLLNQRPHTAQPILKSPDHGVEKVREFIKKKTTTFGDETSANKKRDIEEGNNKSKEGMFFQLISQFGQKQENKDKKRLSNSNALSKKQSIKILKKQEIQRVKSVVHKKIFMQSINPNLLQILWVFLKGIINKVDKYYVNNEQKLNNLMNIFEKGKQKNLNLKDKYQFRKFLKNIKKKNNINDDVEQNKRNSSNINLIKQEQGINLIEDQQDNQLEIIRKQLQDQSNQTSEQLIQQMGQELEHLENEKLKKKHIDYIRKFINPDYGKYKSTINDDISKLEQMIKQGGKRHQRYLKMNKRNKHAIVRSKKTDERADEEFLQRNLKNIDDRLKVEQTYQKLNKFQLKGVKMYKKMEDLESAENEVLKCFGSIYSEQIFQLRKRLESQFLGKTQIQNQIMLMLSNMNLKPMEKLLLEKIWQDELNEEDDEDEDDNIKINNNYQNNNLDNIQQNQNKNQDQEKNITFQSQNNLNQQFTQQQQQQMTTNISNTHFTSNNNLVSLQSQNQLFTNRTDQNTNQQTQIQQKQSDLFDTCINKNDNQQQKYRNDQQLSQNQKNQSTQQKKIRTQLSQELNKDTNSLLENSLTKSRKQMEQVLNKEVSQEDINIQQDTIKSENNTEILEKQELNDKILQNNTIDTSPQQLKQFQNPYLKKNAKIENSQYFDGVQQYSSVDNNLQTTQMRSQEDDQFTITNQNFLSNQLSSPLQTDRQWVQQIDEIQEDLQKKKNYQTWDQNYNQNQNTQSKRFYMKKNQPYFLNQSKELSENQNDSQIKSPYQKQVSQNFINQHSPSPGIKQLQNQKKINQNRIQSAIPLNGTKSKYYNTKDQFLQYQQNQQKSVTSRKFSGKIMNSYNKSPQNSNINQIIFTSNDQIIENSSNLVQNRHQSALQLIKKPENKRIFSALTAITNNIKEQEQKDQQKDQKNLELIQNQKQQKKYNSQKYILIRQKKKQIEEKKKKIEMEQQKNQADFLKIFDDMDQKQHIKEMVGAGNYRTQNSMDDISQQSMKQVPNFMTNQMFQKKQKNNKVGTNQITQRKFSDNLRITSASNKEKVQYVFDKQYNVQNRQLKFI